MSFQQIYMPGNSQEARAIRFLNQAVAAGFDTVETVWGSVTNLSASANFESEYVAATVAVPQPPLGYKVLVEAWLNGSWTSGSVIDADASLKMGERVLAKASLQSEGTAGAVSPHFKAIVMIQDNVNFRMALERNAGRTAIDVLSRGVIARYVKEG